MLPQPFAADVVDDSEEEEEEENGDGMSKLLKLVTTFKSSSP
jgi:hypothetical protein